MLIMFPIYLPASSVPSYYLYLFIYLFRDFGIALSGEFPFVAQLSQICSPSRASTFDQGLRL